MAISSVGEAILGAQAIVIHHETGLLHHREAVVYLETFLEGAQVILGLVMDQAGIQEAQLGIRGLVLDHSWVIYWAEDLLIEILQQDQQADHLHLVHLVQVDYSMTLKTT